MADNAQVPTAPAQDVPNLQLDEVTGEMVSKSELKKRQKKREAEKKKVGPVPPHPLPTKRHALTQKQAEKAAAAPAKAAPKKKDEGVDESTLTPNVRTPLYPRSMLQANW